MVATASQRALSPKQKEFVRQYVLLKDGRRAAIASGYSPKSASNIAYKNLQTPAVKREVSRAFYRNKVQYEKQLAVAMEELYHCVTRRGSDLINPETGLMYEMHEMPERVDAAIDGYEEEVWFDKEGEKHVKRKVKLVSKASAIDMSLKVRGEYAKTNETTVNIDNRSVTILRVPDNGRGPAIEQH